LKPEKPSSAVVDINFASGFGCVTAGGFAAAGGFAVVCAHGVTGGVRFTCRGGTFAAAGFFGAVLAVCFAACRFTVSSISTLLYFDNLPVTPGGRFRRSCGVNSFSSCGVNSFNGLKLVALIADRGPIRPFLARE
jgi:hypothetical protein